MRPLIRVCLMQLLALPLESQAWEPYLRMDAVAFAEPVSVKQYASDWRGCLAPGEDAVGHGRMETGARNGPWSLGLVYRYDYEVRASRGSAVFYHQVANHVPLTPGQVFDLQVQAWHQRSWGVQAARLWALGSQGSLTTTLSLLDGVTLTDGTLGGIATVVSSGDYDYTAQLAYNYSRDHLLKRPVARPDAQGFSLDVSLQWQPTADLGLKVQLSDAIGALYWRRTPNTVAELGSSNKQYDADGYVRYAPTLSGVEGFRSHRQRLHPRASVEANWNWQHGWSLGTRLRLTEVQAFASIIAEHALTPDLSLSAQLLPQQRALGFGGSWAGLQWQIASDRLRFEDAHYLQFSVGYGQRF